ncbi:tryptophan synthase subunit alpha [Metabacillus halosaccharovorans]|uniref:Tryptophan synthase alpha chain n=1 Tax=Metabacillus halosaccharovorans TaxID=930124 RepID=A0ABT3DMR1_9BACI|nr:tryptophan synthase subunit alpha [Metabacillus halosaccharovorans]MCV9888356.1 tryptophan synthase subunit alpha [Metabacillus halosaccharovorans]
MTLFKQSVNSQLFIPFITAGDPHSDVTVDLAIALQDAGASAIELGIPYSDPVADGPVIQKASSRALKNGMNIIEAMKLVPKMRKKGLNIPIILFTYYNPVLQLNQESFFALLRENTIDGLLIPDIPFEESEELRQKCKEQSINFISLVAPTSSSRIKMIAEAAEGFIYCVSSLGVTGVRKNFDESITSFLKEVKSYSSVPVVVGFGVSSREQVELLSNICDGVVVGSALVREIERLQTTLMDKEGRQQAIEDFQQFAKTFVLVNEMK